jgi:hypothetical protein
MGTMDNNMAMASLKETGPKMERIMFGEEEVFCRRIDMLKEYAKIFEVADKYKRKDKTDDDGAEEENGELNRKDIVKAVQVRENIVFDTPEGEKMAIKAGGWVMDDGYAIAAESFHSTYEKI